MEVLNSVVVSLNRRRGQLEMEVAKGWSKGAADDELRRVGKPRGPLMNGIFPLH